MSASPHHSTDSSLAEQLLDAGIPVVVCKPNPRYGEAGQPELITPSGWNTITADEAAIRYVRDYVAGVDTLAMVAGHGIDVLDIDTKVSGVTASDVPNEAYDIELGITVTPSKGFHIPVPSTGYGSGSLYFHGKYVGDYCGGTKDGGSRKLVYLPGSHRPKYGDQVYEMAREWDIDKITDSFPNDFLMMCLDACGLSPEGMPGQQAAESAEIQAFLADHSEIVDCQYGKTAIYGDPLLGRDGLFQETPVFGDHKNGLHAWIVRTVTRATELVKSGCLDAGVYDDIDAQVREFALKHHEKGRYRQQEVMDCLAWALSNTGSDSGCNMHDPSAKNYKGTAASPAAVLPSVASVASSGSPTDPNDAMAFLDWNALLTTDVTDEYIVPHFLCKGQAAVLYAPAGTGKSLLSFEWAVQLALGGVIFDQNLKEHIVLYVDHENPVASVRDRLESLGIDSTPVPDALTRNLHYSSMGAWLPLDTEAGGQQLLQWALHFGADVVFIDTAAMATTGQENEANTYTDLARYTTRPLKAHGIAVVRIDHAGKDKERGQRGSSAKSADVDLVYRLDKETDVVFCLTREKNRPGLGGEQKIRVKRLSDPLRHEITYTNPKHEDAVNGLIKAMDEMDLPLDTSRRKAAAELTANGYPSAKSATLGEAIKRRRSARNPLPTVSEVIDNA